MIYEMDFTLQVIRLLGVAWRTPDRIAWLTLAVFKIQELHAELLAFRLEKLKELSYNSQTMVFEGLLNDKFPNPGRKIYIQNRSSLGLRTYIYNLSENERTTSIYQLVENPV